MPERQRQQPAGAVRFPCTVTFFTCRLAWCFCVRLRSWNCRAGFVAMPIAASQPCAGVWHLVAHMYGTVPNALQCDQAAQCLHDPEVRHCHARHIAAQLS